MTTTSARIGRLLRSFVLTALLGACTLGNGGEGEELGRGVDVLDAGELRGLSGRGQRPDGSQLEHIDASAELEPDATAPATDLAGIWHVRRELVQTTCDGSPALRESTWTISREGAGWVVHSNDAAPPTFGSNVAGELVGTSAGGLTWTFDLAIDGQGLLSGSEVGSTWLCSTTRGVSGTR